MAGRLCEFVALGLKTHCVLLRLVHLLQYKEKYVVFFILLLLLLSAPANRRTVRQQSPVAMATAC